MNKQKIVIPSGIGLAAVLRVGHVSWLVKLWSERCRAVATQETSNPGVVIDNENWISNGSKIFTAQPLLIVSRIIAVSQESSME